MYSNMGAQPGGQQQPFTNHIGAQPGGHQQPFPNQASPFGNPFNGPGSGLIRSGLSAYGEKILGSSSEYVQSNVSNALVP
ncbi:hypothetical protein KSS87_019523 [Heliosperma pusillum]|nr:hypothetical protein KSS87_019523 [Heliosperma pusillum]